ncbi:MAG: hypothetical protein JRN01_05120 [Nitrososphaerota archaeon]|nr:hypothetical protein [Nitrososphaerota archaeon]
MINKSMYGKTSAMIVFALVSTMMLLSPIAANAATVTVTAYPAQNVSNVMINDSVYMIFTYPANSFVSNALNGSNYSYKLSASNIPYNSGAFMSFQNALQNKQGEDQQGDPQNSSPVTLLNMSVTESKSMVANTTTMVLSRSTIINAWVSGIFNKTSSGRIVGNFGWKSFRVDSQFDVNFNGESEDINFIGNSFFAPMGNSFGMMSFLMAAPLGQISQIPTINFSAFNTPLSQWTRTYNSATGITTFTKSVSSQTLYNASLSVNGKTYLIRVISDPSYTLNVKGYALATGNTITVTSPPTNYAEYAAVAVIVVVIAVAGTLMYFRKK